MLANASSSQDVDRTFDQVKSQHSLVVHWHRSNTVTVQAPLRFNEDGRVVSQLSVRSYRSVEQYGVCILRTYRSGTNQLPSSWNNICTFVFFCSFCGVTLLLRPDKRRCHVDSESQDRLGARHSNGYIPWTLAYCICPC